MLEDESAMLRTGEDVKASGEISQQTAEQLLQTLHRYHELGEKHGAQVFLALATEAMREARNGQELVGQIERETGLAVHIIPGTLEASLTYHGATSEPGVPPDAGALDIGGGSTELITARQRHITWLTSLPIGSGWLHEQYLTANPPMTEEIEEAQEFLHRYISQLHVPHLPLSLMVTGSSAKSLLKVAKHALKLDEKSDRLTRKDLTACLGILQNVRAEEAAQRYELETERARVLPGGALILLEMMAYLRLDEIRVSHAGVRQGALLSYAHYGEEWLEHPEVRLDDSKIGVAPPLPKQITRKPEANQPFAQSGHDELVKRVGKFLDRQDEVLKNEDVEAVHKMRVASRRLRATMDAYQSAGQRKSFQRSYKRIKQAADLLGAARDSDVMMQRIDELLQQSPAEEQPGLRWFKNRLLTCRKQEQQQLETFFQSFAADDFEQRVVASIPAGGGARG
jgi:exopolyphosphatase/pppGpp-phosphohydrolase